VNATKSLLVASLFLSFGNAFAQPVDEEPAAVVELGGAASWNLKVAGRASAPTSQLKLRLALRET